MADEKSFKLEIITPGGIVFEGEAAHVRAPGREGSFGVLPGHASLITPLEIGVIEVEPDSGGQEVYATSGGVAEVHGDHVVILAETAERAEDIDVSRAEQAKKRAEERLGVARDTQLSEEDVDLDRAQIALLRAINRIRVAARGIG